jgi:homoserine acetyltransferase
MRQQWFELRVSGLLQATAFWLVIVGLCVLVMAGCAGAAQAQNDQADRQAAAWKAIVDQIAAIDPNRGFFTTASLK